MEGKRIMGDYKNTKPQNLETSITHAAFNPENCFNVITGGASVNIKPEKYL